MAGPVHVKGLAELQRGFRKIDKDVSKELRGTLKKSAEPVRADAASRASRIGNVTGDWSEMRTGVTTNVVYVAPKRRQTKIQSRRRPNLANLLMDRAMQPALAAHADQIEHDVGELLDEFFRAWERL